MAVAKLKWTNVLNAWIPTGYTSPKHIEQAIEVVFREARRRRIKNTIKPDNPPGAVKCEVFKKDGLWMRYILGWDPIKGGICGRVDLFYGGR